MKESGRAEDSGRNIRIALFNLASESALREMHPFINSESDISKGTFALSFHAKSRAVTSNGLISNASKRACIPSAPIFFSADA